MHVHHTVLKIWSWTDIPDIFVGWFQSCQKHNPALKCRKVSDAVSVAILLLGNLEVISDTPIVGGYELEVRWVDFLLLVQDCFRSGCWRSNHEESTGSTSTLRICTDTPKCWSYPWYKWVVDTYMRNICISFRSCWLIWPSCWLIIAKLLIDIVKLGSLPENSFSNVSCIIIWWWSRLTKTNVVVYESTTRQFVMIRLKACIIFALPRTSLPSQSNSRRFWNHLGSLHVARCEMQKTGDLRIGGPTKWVVGCQRGPFWRYWTIPTMGPFSKIPRDFRDFFLATMNLSRKFVSGEGGFPWDEKRGATLP